MESEKQNESGSVVELVATFVHACQSSMRDESCSIVWKHFEIDGAGRGHEIAPTVASLPEKYMRSIMPIKTKQFSRTLLHDFNGSIKAGEMLMVIGRPGSGCTTFLKSLSHMHGEYKTSRGILSYGGMEADFKKPTAPQETTFCAENDLHFPSLTVEETLRFAVNSRFKNVMSKAEVKKTVVDLARLFGIDHILSTQVGDEKIRGISGGEKKRVTLAEALVTCPDLVCYDNPTAGLDSSTAIEFIQMMREYTTQTHCSMAASIYQGSDDMVPLFDKVLVINTGRCIYYGPVATAKSYFEGLGFHCPPSMSITDFLNSMTADPEARQLRDDVGLSNVPQTPEEFDSAFKRSPLGIAVLTQDASDSIATKSPQSAAHAKKPKLYPIPIITQIMLCAYRQFRIWVTDYNAWVIEAVCLLLQSLVLGTVFRNLPRDTQSLYQVGYVIFFAIMVPSLQSMSEFGNTFAQRPLLLKHKSYRFYHPISYAYGQILSDLVLKIALIAYNIPMYFLADLQRTASHFFIFFLIAYITHICLSMFFRFVAVLSPNVDKAGLPVGIFFLTLVVYMGQYIPPPAMQVWLRWIIYLNPLYYGFESLMINEVGSAQYTCSSDEVIPRGNSYTNVAFQTCAIPGSVPGQTTVEGAAYLREFYGFETSDLWRDVGINAAFFVFFAVLVGLGMQLFKPPAGKLATVFYRKVPRHSRFSPASSDTDLETQKESSVTKIRKTSSAAQNLASIQGHSFAFKDFHLTTKTKDGEKTILSHLDGVVQPSTMTALMGVSGAGKTTLLNSLSGRVDFGKSSGTLYLDGKPLPKSFRRRMGYVQQQDVHLPTQTVREALLFPAYLRRGDDVPVEEKAAYVEQVLEMLQIEDIADALIGIPGAGLNLEQRKRVSMGVEMAAKPAILFLDEPTSGLDGESAISMTQLMKRLSRSGQTIICTIHQPSAAVMESFDNLILLAKGGLMTYQGSYGQHAQTVLQYIGRFAEACEPTRNPAEYLLSTVGAGSRSKNTTDWAQIWAESEEAQVLLADLDRAINSGVAEKSTRQRTFAMSFGYQLKVVLHRTWLWSWRDPDYVSSKLWLHLALGLMNGLTFLNIDDTQQGAYNRVLTIFIAFLTGPPVGLSVIPRFIALRDIFVYRESASRSYHWMAFAMSAIAVELPYTIIATLVFFLVWYFPAGLQPGPDIAGYELLAYLLCGVFIMSLGYLIAAWMPNLNASLMANGFFFMWVNIFGGVLTAKTLTPSGWRWYFTVSPFYYLSDGMVADTLYDYPISCSSKELISFTAPPGMSCGNYTTSFFQDPTATGYLMNPEASSTCQYCRYSNGQQYYQQYDYDYSMRWPIIGIFIGFIAFNFTFVFVGTYLTKIAKFKRLA